MNAAFDQQLSLADEGYESSSDTIDLPTPLRKTPRIHHVSSMEHASFEHLVTYIWTLGHHITDGTHQILLLLIEKALLILLMC